MNPPPIPHDLPTNVQLYLRDLSQYVQMELDRRTADITARHSIILLSPNGSAWEVTVDDLGALTTTKVAG